MIDKFEVGKWYVFDTNKHNDIFWSPHGLMDFLKDGRPHQCTVISKYDDMFANFDGRTDGIYDGGTWSFRFKHDKITEVAVPKADVFKRGDVILVTDYVDDDNWMERIFVSYVEGATDPYVVAGGDEKENFRNGKPFAIYTYKYGKPLPKEDKELKELEENLRKAEKALEEYKKLRELEENLSKAEKAAEEALEEYKKEKSK